MIFKKHFRLGSRWARRHGSFDSGDDRRSTSHALYAPHRQAVPHARDGSHLPATPGEHYLSGGSDSADDPTYRKANR